MSSTEKQGDVTTQSKEVQDKEKNHGDVKSDTSPLKRSAAELNNTDDEVKQKVLKTSHKEDKENGESEEKYEDDGEDEDDVVPDDYDEEAEDGEGDEDGADDDEDEEEDA